MEWFAANPAGWWALLGLPAILLIHFLQRQSRELTVSTLFLLQHLQRESREGKRIDRLRSSVPLWLQLLLVLLLTLLLVDPRRLRPDSVQPVAVVLDESASMMAFAGEARTELLRALGQLDAAAARSEYYVVGSALAGRNFYRGTDLAELESSLRAWEPRLGEHEFAPALRVARNAVGPSGVVILVTDHPGKELPFAARRLAVGRKIENTGFTGLEIREEGDAARWRALVRNFGDAPAERSWFLAAGEQRSPAQSFRLEPGEVRVLEGGFPEGAAERIRLQLDADGFGLDDVLPLLRPEPRTIFIASRVSPRVEGLTARVIGSISQAREPGEGEPPPDLVFASYDPLNPALPEGNAVVFLDREPKFAKPVAGRLLAEEHPLVTHLNWEPLIHLDSVGIPPTANDRVVLWREEKPLVLARQTPQGARQLLFAFDVATSNADKLPAFVLAIHRFAESIRADKPDLERRVLETGQPLRLPASGSANGLALSRFVSWDGQEIRQEEIPPADWSRLRAPRDPGYLEIWQGDTPLLQGTTFFADAREGDFRSAGAEDQVAGLSVSLVRRHTETGLNSILWVLLTMAVLLGTWAWMAWRRSLVADGG